MNIKYEYIIRCFDGLTTPSICDELNKLGAEGWKLLSTPHNLSCNGINSDLSPFVFMREYAELRLINE